jgi:trimeric autotransporter adhesin
MRTFRPALRPGALAAGLVLLLATPAVAQSDILLQLESGSPAGDRFVVDSAGGFVARGNYGQGTIPLTGAGARLMWHPRKAAFRVGRVTGSQWDDANIGNSSVATGYNTTASGGFSTATGGGTTASGSYSTAMGYNTTASESFSTATGAGSTASAQSSTAMGQSTTASGWASTAMGVATTASGGVSTAMGDGTTASGLASTAMGSSTTASGSYSTAMGLETTASGLYSTAMGESTRASGTFSTAMGRRASTQGFSGSFVYGDATTNGDTVRASMTHQATWRTTGGFRVFTNSALTTGCSIAAGGGAWSCTSSRLEKENFAAVDGEEVLRRLRDVPVTSWNGIAEGPEVRHIGPMAQDWHAAFALNDDPLTIHQGDLAGVSLAAVQALDERTRGVPGVERELAVLRAENAALRADAALQRGEAAALRDEAAWLRAEAAEQRARLERQRARLERLEALVAALVTEP